MQEIPWMDIIGLFIFLSGFIIGLGAVTVIDLHGFLGRKSLTGPRRPLEPTK